MKKIAKYIIVPLITFIILSASSCDVKPADDAINFWIDSRLEAVESGDVDAYMQTVNRDNYYLYNEEFNLISSLDADELSSISITASQVTADEKKTVYRISQQYEYRGEHYKSAYEAEFIKQGRELYYNGAKAEVYEAGGVMVYHPDGYIDNAKQYISAVNYYLQKLNKVYAYTPDPGISIKLYDDHEVFLQSVKFDLPKWVGGWHEYGESVKIYVPVKNVGISPGTVYHECTHRFLSEVSNDNASYWLQEGTATLMETAIPTGLANIEFLYNNDIESLKRAGSLWRFEDFVHVNLEALSDPVQVMGYYALSALCVWHIIDAAGIDSFLVAVSGLKENPQIRVTASEKIQETNDMTIKALSELLNMSEDDFYQHMDAFIDTYR